MNLRVGMKLSFAHYDGVAIVREINDKSNMVVLGFQEGDTELVRAFPISYILSHCEVADDSKVPAGTKSVKRSKRPKKKPALKAPEETKEPEKTEPSAQDDEKQLKEITESFNRNFHFTEDGLCELRDFFVFHRNYARGHGRPLRYNLLVICEDIDDEKQFFDRMKDALTEIGHYTFNSDILSEASLGQYLSSKSLAGRSLIGITGCTSFGREEAGTSDVSRTEERRKDGVWERAAELSNAHPDCTILAFGNEGFLDYIEQSDALCRMFPHRIILEPMTTEDVRREILAGIRAEGLRISSAFSTGLRNYIEDVYPKSDLRGHSFVDEILNRILVSYYMDPSSPYIRKQCLPSCEK